MKFVNRTAEMERLDKLALSGRPGLVAVWGRRRIGKTRLLLEWCPKHRGIYTVADLSTEKIQRGYLAQSLNTRFPGFGEVDYPDWKSFFRALAREAGRNSWKGPLVFDEFPSLVEASPALPSVLQGFLDHEGREANLLVVISGSSQHMMQGFTLNPGAPLYGRITASLALSPMSPGALMEALALKNGVTAMRAYSFWGGVPRYWELAESVGAELDAAVEYLVLDPLGPLHLEPDRLLVEERPPAIALRPILDAIGAGAHRVSEIAGRVGVPATSLARGLTRLADVGLVRKEQPFGDSERSGKKSLYKIADPFFRMWFRVVAPHRAFLAAARSSGRRKLWEQYKNRLLAEAWEETCRLALPALGETGETLSGYGGWSPAGRFWGGSGPEWDVVARSQDKTVLLLGEVKWHERPVSEKDLDKIHSELLSKEQPRLAGSGAFKETVYALFVPECQPGLKRHGRSYRIVTAEDVIRALG